MSKITAKPLTLMAMSGVGKTHWAWQLEKWGWYHYNVDYLIGAEYLKGELESPVKLDDLGPLSKYIGQVGKGALPMDEFKRRQKNYIEAERRAMMDLEKVIAAKGANVVVDSTGSLCEIGDEDLYKRLGAQTLIVYIKAAPEEEAALVEQAMNDPKPLYFPPAQFDAWLAAYLKEKNLKSVDDVTPNDFSRWVFPKLFQSRLPKYQAIADKYGVTVRAQDLRGITTQDAFFNVIQQAKR